MSISPSNSAGASPISTIYQMHNEPLVLKHTPLPIPSFPSVENWPTNVIKASLVTPGYREITANIVDKNLGSRAWELLDSKIEGLPDKENQIKSLCEAMEHHDWNHPIFQNSELFPYYGLAALKNNKLTISQFATLMGYWSILQHHEAKDIKVVKLFNEDGTPNEEAKQMIETTLHLYPQSKPLIQNMPMKENFLDKNQLDQFFAEMKKLPKSEQQFFVIPDIQNPPKTGLDELTYLANMLTDKITISQEINYTPGINILNRIKDGEENKRIIPSLGMMQNFLNVCFGENAVTMKPKIGLGLVEDIENNGLTMTREFSIPFPGVDYPKMADYFQAKQEYDFMWHDFYHAIIASHIPANHQKAFILIAKIVKDLPSRGMPEEFKEYQNELYHRIIDMEHEPFRTAGIDNLSLAFYSSLNQLMQNTIARLGLEKISKKRKEGGIDDNEIIDLYKTTLMQLVNEINTLFEKYNLYLEISKEIINQKEKFVAINFLFEPIFLNLINSNFVDAVENLLLSQGITDYREVEKSLKGFFTVQLEKALSEA